ncbi:uncharacterized protein LOC129265250 [Lytechinus pictus]|uniref:uncharacterized protein LOC129265250 n=1 Tax=Lytechinus pictus TaxID=7653 RepID=UPI0030B9BB8A
MTTDAGFIAGVTVGAAIASAFLFACLYSAYRAVMDRRRIVAKNKYIRDQRLLAAAECETGAPVAEPAVAEPATSQQLHKQHLSPPEGIGRQLRAGSAPNIQEARRGSAFKPPPTPTEKRWTRQGLQYRHEGGCVHIHKTDSTSGDANSECGSRKNSRQMDTADLEGDVFMTVPTTHRQRSASADVTHTAQSPTDRSSTTITITQPPQKPVYLSTDGSGTQPQSTTEAPKSAPGSKDPSWV